MVFVPAHNVLDRTGRTALDWPRQNGHTDVVALLEGHERLLHAQQFIKPAVREGTSSMLQSTELDSHHQQADDAQVVNLLDQHSGQTADTAIFLRIMCVSRVFPQGALSEIAADEETQRHELLEVTSRRTHFFIFALHEI
eukprot:m.34582 g.34582  ORF g.34582 m.34582 type:complete len:140 (+) comp43596_c0_seq2:201-620(+)